MLLSSSALAQQQAVSLIPNTAQVVALGDPTHQEKHITTLRVDLIKALVEERGFSIILIEGNLYELFRAGECACDDAHLQRMREAMYAQLNVPELDELHRFVCAQRAKDAKLTIGGFDPSFSGSHYVERMRSDLNRLAWLPSDEADAFIELLEKATISDLRAVFMRRKHIRAALKKTATKILSEDSVHTADALFVQALRNLRDYQGNGAHSRRDNLRDSLMAENVKFMQSLYPGEKLILYGSLTHLMKRADAVDSPYMQNKRIPMGQRLTADLGDAYFVLGYTVIEGVKRGVNLREKRLPPPEAGSLEATMYTPGDEEYRLLAGPSIPKHSVPSRLFGHRFTSMRVHEVVDAVVGSVQP